MSDIKLKDLRYLVAVADTRHFGRAAQRCFVSQPTLSAQLKKLEASLGVQLIERQPSNVALTDAGRQIVERARRIIEACDEVGALARSHRDPLAGTLRVALLPTIGPYLLPCVTRPIQCELPRLRLYLHEYQTAPMLAKLRAGELDLGILALPVELEGLEALELYSEPFVAALPERHRLARRGHHSASAAGHRGNIRQRARRSGRAVRKTCAHSPGGRRLAQDNRAPSGNRCALCGRRAARRADSARQEPLIGAAMA